MKISALLHLADIVAFQAQLRTNGLPVEEVRLLSQFGLSPVDVQSFVDRLISLAPEILVGLDLEDVFNVQADLYRGYAQSARRLDADRDGLSDLEEATIYGSNPLVADSDGDGLDDAAEVAAGTDPIDPVSVFRIAELTVNASGRVTLRWWGRNGKKYRLVRASDPMFKDPTVVAVEVLGAEPLTTYQDLTFTASDTATMFWRIELLR